MAVGGKISVKSAQKMSNAVFEKKDKKLSKKKKESYALHIHKVLRQVHLDTGISSKAMPIMNRFVNDVFERIAIDSSKLAAGTTLLQASDAIEPPSRPTEKPSTPFGRVETGDIFASNGVSTEIKSVELDHESITKASTSVSLDLQASRRSALASADHTWATRSPAVSTTLADSGLALTSQSGTVLEPPGPATNTISPHVMSFYVVVLWGVSWCSLPFQVRAFLMWFLRAWCCARYAVLWGCRDASSHQPEISTTSIYRVCL